MRRVTKVETRRYRGFSLEVRDEHGAGWSVAIYPPRGASEAPVTLRSSVPRGLEPLIAEARARVDRRLDGQALDRL